MVLHTGIQLSHSTEDHAQALAVHKAKTHPLPLDNTMCQIPLSPLTRNTENTEGFSKSMHYLFIDSSASVASLSIHEAAGVGER